MTGYKFLWQLRHNTQMAKKHGAEICFGDAAHIRSDHHAGRTWGKKGETPIVKTPGARHRMSLISRSPHARVPAQSHRN
jgi:hypothetical protein